ncbi:MAG: Diacylglycerol O-acyltransferase [Actinomycetospora sp.]|nr:Diacylglycerol O-acyltransferase [Actinomycetospora sp.]
MNAVALSPLDAAFLEIEDAEPGVSMAIASIAVFAGPAPTTDEFARHLAGRLPLIPRYRQKVRRVPFDLGTPVWVDDPGFVLEHHLVRVALPAPGGDAELAALMGRVMATRLDRDRPLWRYWLVEGLAGGRWALISQVHHCLVDGVSGTDLYRVVLDPEPHPRPAAPETGEPAPEPSAGALLLGAAGHLAALPVALARAAGSLVTAPGRGARAIAAGVQGAAALLGSLRPARPSSLSGPLHRPRAFAIARGRVADVRAARHRYGGTFNDVVLAAVTAGFRDLLLARGEEPVPDLVRTLVPVSVRAPGDEGSRGNQVSLLLPRLPVHVADPAERLAATITELETCKAEHEAEAGVLLTELAHYPPYALVAGGVRWASRTAQRAVVTVTTDVPGPRTTLYGLGRELEEIIPYVPVGSTLRIGVAILSYRDALVVGLTGDETADDLDVLARGIETELACLAHRRDDAGARRVSPGPPAPDGR